MPPAWLRRPLVVLALLAVVAWFGNGLLHVVGLRLGLPPGVIGLLAPSTPAAAWVREPVRGLPSALLDTAVLVGVLVLASRRTLHGWTGTFAARVLALWFAVLVAGVATTAAATLVLASRLVPLGGDALLVGMLDGVRHGGAWGVAHGWAVALLAVLLTGGKPAPPVSPTRSDRVVPATALAAAIAGVGWTVVALLHAWVDATVTANVSVPRSGTAAALRGVADWLLPVTSATDAHPAVVLLSGVLVAAITAAITYPVVRRVPPAAGRGTLVQPLWVACVVAAALGALPTVLGGDALDPAGDGRWLRAQDALLGPTDGGAAGLLWGWVAALAAVAVLRTAAQPVAVPRADGVPRPADDDVPPSPRSADSPVHPVAATGSGTRATGWRDPRVMIPLLTVATWLLGGLLHREAVRAGAPDGLVGLLAPTTPAAFLGTRSPGPDLVLPLVVLVAVAVLVSWPAIRATGSSTAVRSVAVWFAVVVAGVAAALVHGLSTLLALGGAGHGSDTWQLVLGMDWFAHVRSSSAWGVAFGWVVALVVGRLAWRGEATEVSTVPARTAPPSAGSWPVAHVAVGTAALMAGVGWAVAATTRAAVMRTIAEHAPGQEELAWQARVATTWLLPVGDVDHHGYGWVLVSAVLVAVVVAAITWWAVRAPRPAPPRGSDRVLVVQAVWLACVVGATLGPLPAALLHAWPSAPGDYGWQAGIPGLGPTEGGAVGLLYGWSAGVAVAVVVAPAMRRTRSAFRS